MPTRTNEHDTTQRAIDAILGVLPPSARDTVIGSGRSGVTLGGRHLDVRWVGEGNLGDVKAAIGDHDPRPDVVVGRRLSRGARVAASEAGIGWVDETGAAEIAVGQVIVSRSGRPPTAIERPKRWTPAVLAVAEALLCDTKATVAETQSATGLSAGSCTSALRFLTDQGLLEAAARRGRGSARRVRDERRLLDAYAVTAAATPESVSLTVGTTWRDPVAGLVEVGTEWDSAGVRWAATGLAAASALAPLITTITSTEVYLAVTTIIGLESAAVDVGLRPIDGGRLTLRPFPTVAVDRMANELDGLRVAPWPRVFVDLRKAGVRGEEAAEHLREVMHGG
jgi:hypothetical protein